MAKTTEARNSEAVSPVPGATMSLAEFNRKWGPAGLAYGLNERAGAQSHFIDLCRLLGVDTPDDPKNYCFERGLWGAETGRRFADVWRRGFFAWEYKAPGGDLRQALAQLMQYALRLENPPLLIVSDRRTIQIHTHFTGHPSLRIDIAHAELRDPRKIALLRSAFLSPQDFRPAQSRSQITADLATKFAFIAKPLRDRGETPFRTAHFLTQCAFCCFAESVEVLPAQVFRRLVQKRQSPTSLQRSLTRLFETMSVGGDFGIETIPWFNGGLFKVVDVPLLTEDEAKTLAEAASSSWSAIDPSILGTLFERGLDPAKRNQMGAHYTDAATIERLIDPVVRQPLLAEWDGIKRDISALMSKRDVLAVRAKGVPSRNPTLIARHGALRSQASQAHGKAKNLLSGFMDRMQSVRVLDPACGSGNFLFLALKALKDIEHQVNDDAEDLGLGRQLSVTGPHNVLGIESNEYAAELARATVWIGELQWRKEHGYGWNKDPILAPLDHIECRDAVLSPMGCEATWPKADVVVSNPPFAGDKKMRGELGSEYTEALRSAYKGRVSASADLVCYWFEKARAQIEAGHLRLAGLVATNSIRGGKNRLVLDRILATTRIFEAWSDESWVNDGAAVRVSLIAFGAIDSCRLNGQAIESISSDLASSPIDLTRVVRLTQNAGACFQGTSKVGPFEVSREVATSWLKSPNVHPVCNATVVRPWTNGQDLTRRPSDTWIVDFGTDMPEHKAARFDGPYRYALEHVKPEREANNREAYRRYWWRHAEARSGMRNALESIDRYIATPRVAKHRVFVWQPSSTLPDTAVVVTCRADDSTFGLLQSRPHELWALRLGSSLEDRPRYTPTTCFETFPFPSGLTPADTAHRRTEAIAGGAIIPSDLAIQHRKHAIRIARAAKELVTLRSRWLNPPEWTRSVPDVIPLGLDHSPYPDRIVAKAGFEGELAKRTLTNLYNQRPAWLEEAHAALDAAVALAYGWSDYSHAMSDDEILRRLLALNRQRPTQKNPHPQRELTLFGVIGGEHRNRSDKPKSASRGPVRATHRKRAV